MHNEIFDDLAQNKSWTKLIRAWMYQMRFNRNTVEKDVDELFNAAKGNGINE